MKIKKFFARTFFWVLMPCPQNITFSLAGNGYSKHSSWNDSENELSDSVSIKNAMGKQRIQAFKRNKINITRLLKTFEQKSNNNKELTFLQFTSDIVRKKLNRFVNQKNHFLNNKTTLTKHAYSILFTMEVFNYAAWDAIKVCSYDSARDLAKDDTWNLAGDAALDTGSTSCFGIVGNVVKIASRDAAWDTGWDLARYASLETIKDLNKYARYVALENANAAASEGNSPYEIGAIAYHVTERIALLIFMSNLEDILEKSYNASIEKMNEDPQNNIFSSLNNWIEFEKRYFSIRPDARQFLDPWIVELKAIAKEIETLENDS